MEADDSSWDSRASHILVWPAVVSPLVISPTQAQQDLLVVSLGVLLQGEMAEI